MADEKGTMKTADLPAQEPARAAEGAAPAAGSMPEDHTPKKKAPQKKKHTVLNVILIIVAVLVAALIIWGCM